MNSFNKVLDVMQLPSPLQRVEFDEWEPYDVEVYFKRDDLIHPIISGNKWRKSYGHLLKFFEGNYNGILTFGGAYSNHLIAVAAIAEKLGIPSIGIVRGEINDNPALEKAKECGMKLIPLNRTVYRNKDISELIQLYPEIDFSKFNFIPEGGGGEAGMVGCQSIIDEISLPFDYIVSACGTGTTLAGLVNVLSEKVFAVGVSVLKGEDTLTTYIKHLTKKENFEVFEGFHFGGYARTTDELLSFARRFMNLTSIPLDYVYTAKMVFAFNQLLKQGYFPKGSRIVLLHTGGLYNAPII
ncbi:MAG: pyridoxal-phosphate dependent enzyme [Chitinophagales bacterium]|nr:pyridoxal-phosphate dependent enzyme [Chitinophagales bacterium]